MAETCTTGFLQRGLAVMPHYRGIDLWALVRQHGLDRWGGARAECLHRRLRASRSWGLGMLP